MKILQEQIWAKKPKVDAICKKKRMEEERTVRTKTKKDIR